MTTQSAQADGQNPAYRRSEASNAKALLAFAFERASLYGTYKCSAVSEAEKLRFSASEQTSLYGTP